MNDWFYGIVFNSAPFVLPAIVFICARLYGYERPAQKMFTVLSIALYAFSLLAFAIHAWQIGIPDEFFRAYFGSPFDSTPWCAAGTVGQILSAISVLIAVNWRVVRLYFGGGKAFTLRDY